MRHAGAGTESAPPLQVSRLGVGAEPSLGSLWHLPRRGDGSFVGPESADASMVSLGSQLTTSSSTAATQRLSDSVSSRFGHWRGFKVGSPEPLTLGPPSLAAPRRLTVWRSGLCSMSGVQGRRHAQDAGVRCKLGLAAALCASVDAPVPRRENACAWCLAAWTSGLCVLWLCQPITALMWDRMQGPGIFQKHQRKTSLRHMVLRSNSSTMTTATQLSVRISPAGLGGILLSSQDKHVNQPTRA